MQPTTVDGGALEAALLSPEQLQSLSKMARILGKGMEEVTRNIASYQAAPGPVACGPGAANHEAVQQ